MQIPAFLATATSNAWSVVKPHPFMTVHAGALACLTLHCAFDDDRLSNEDKFKALNCFAIAVAADYALVPALTRGLTHNPVSTLLFAYAGHKLWGAACDDQQNWSQRPKQACPFAAALVVGLALRVLGPHLFTHRLTTWIR